ncbi:hypothetical protein GEMRC1_009859 [Eukaryota sp. GEM-RC1]
MSLTRTAEKVFPFRDQDAAIRSVVILAVAILLGAVTSWVLTKWELSPDFLHLVELPGVVWSNIITSIIVFYILALIALNVIDVCRTGKNLNFTFRYLLYVYIGHTISAVLAVIVYFIFSSFYENPSFPSPDFAPAPLFTGYIDALTAVVRNFVRPSFLSTLVNHNFASIIFFSILFGVTIHRLSYTGTESILARTTVFFNSFVFDVSLLIPSIVVFSLVFTAFAGHELSWGPLTYSFIVGWVLLAVVIYPAFYWILTKDNPFKFLFKIQNSPIFAFATRSSITTVPITLSTMEKEMNIDRHVRELLVPVSAVLNVPGSVFYGVLFSLISLKLFGDGPSFGNIVYLLLFGNLLFIGLSGATASFGLTFSLISVMSPECAPGFLTMYTLEFFMDAMRSALNSMADFFVIAAVAKSLETSTKQINKLTVPAIQAPKPRNDLNVI